MQIPDDIIEKIKEQNDIVDVISEVVRLKRTGRNYSGLCPFHNEKSPSFSVSQDKQIFKCFGCGEAGNVISFVMKNKNIPFIDAIKYLAERANVPLVLNSDKPSAQQMKRQQLYTINTQAARYFYSNLHNDYKAKEYFLRRGITENILKSFGLGYSKDGWRNTLDHLRRLGFKDQLIEEAGLIIKNEKGNIYDRFRNRVMFPVFDYSGKVIGFGGRVLDDSKPKYLNSPETLVFQKGTNLYGLNFAIKGGLKDRQIIVVEGYMDCISLHQYGITNSVASLGTALTDNQARLLKRYVDKVIISYDADIAGQMATLRGLEVLTNAGLDVRVLVIPMGKDPDEFIRVNGKEAFLRLINNAQKLIDYKLNKLKDGVDFNDPRQLNEFTQKLIEIFNSINHLERNIYIKKVSEGTPFTEQALLDLLNNNLINNNKNLENMNNMKEYGTKLNVEPIYIKWERIILKLLCKEKWHDSIKKYLNEDDFIELSHKELMILIIKVVQESGFDDINKRIELRCQQPNILKEWLKIIELEFIDDFTDVEAFIKPYIYRIKRYRLENEAKNIKRNMDIQAKNGNLEEAMKLAKQSKDISDKLKELERSK